MECPHIANFPLEVLHQILIRLPLDAVVNLRLAGLGSNHPDIDAMLTNLVPTADKLRTLLAAMTPDAHAACLNRTKSVSSAAHRSKKRQSSMRVSPINGSPVLHEREKEEDWPPSPVKVAEGCKWRAATALHVMNSEEVNAIKLCMPNLQTLSVFPAWNRREAWSIPKELSELTKIRSLKIELSHRDNVSAFPECVLHLQQLRDLCLYNFRNLTKLPEDLGEQLPNLCYLHLKVRRMQSVPLSILRTLERNCPQPSSRHGIYIYETQVPGGSSRGRDEWQAMLPADAFPTLSRYTHRHSGPCFSLGRPVAAAP